MTFKEMLRQRIHHDLGFGFYTKSGVRKRMEFYAKSSGILCGTVFIPTLVEIVEKEFFLKPYGQDLPVSVYRFKPDGKKFSEGDALVRLEGDLEVLLKVERHVCDLLQRLSGIATHVKENIEKVRGTPVFLLDTRKDNPLDRELDKYAITVGGARMHRGGLYDGTLIKDTDIAACGGIREAIGDRAAKTKFLTKIEIEVGDLGTLDDVLEAGRVDVIMLDNMSPEALHNAVARIRKEKKPYIIEASGVGGFDLRAIAESGVDAISLSSLVDGAKRLDISKRITDI